MFKDLGNVIYTNELVKSERDITHIVIHCSATVAGRHYDARTIHQWHKDGNGWSGIGYHYVVCTGGTIEIGRNVDYDGAHVYGHNANSIGICLIGGLGEDTEPRENAFTKDQYMVLDDMLRKMMCMYPKAKILGHRDFDGVKKACPCMDVADFITGMEC